MVGGKVINIVKTEHNTWIQCLDATYNDVCAIRVKDAKEMKVGDLLWWHGRWAYWTPNPKAESEDIPLERVGYSHSKIPNEILRLIHET